MHVVVSLLKWIGRACNLLYWAGHYFSFPPDETDHEEMAEYHRRLSN